MKLNKLELQHQCDWLCMLILSAFIYFARTRKLTLPFYAQVHLHCTWSFLVRSPKDGELLGLEWGMIL